MTAEWSAVEWTDEDDIAETITRRDYEEGVAAFRGLLVGLVLSVAIVGACAVSGLVVWMVVTR